MTINELVEVFNSIKPTFAEIEKLESNLSRDIITEICEEYNLKVIANGYKNVEVFEVIKNTNISNLHFSSINFYSEPSVINDFLRVGYIEEYGELYLNEKKMLIYFYDDRVEQNKLSDGMTEKDFWDFYLIYIKMYFEKIFRFIRPSTDYILEIESKLKSMGHFDMPIELIHELN
jgi:hypothetical protein